MNASETATELLDAAQHLTQERGFNAFSYKDLAESVGIRTASIHYHFRTKADLGQALMDRYLSELERALAAIDQRGRSNKAKLKSFIKTYRDTESRGAICLCGSMATDKETLTQPLQDVVAAYLERTESWVSDKIGEGVRLGEFAYSGKPRDAAASLVSGLQGGLILSRATHGDQRIGALQRVFLNALGAA